MSGDPYWASTVFLAHCNGTHGSTSFIDERGHSLSAVGNAKISTAQSKFGGASAVFDGSGDRVASVDSADYAFGTGDFTIEFFAYLINGGHGGAWARLLENYYWPNAGGWGFVCTSSNNPAYIRFDTSDGLPILSSVATVPNNTWTHVAVSRASGVIRLFINGVLQGSSSTVRNFTRQRLSIGANSNGAGEAFYGYLDEIRLTKGVARYTANFAVPTAEFPNFAVEQNINGAGIDAAHFGASVTTHTRITPQGISAPKFGVSSILNLDRRIYFTGAKHTQFGVSSIFNATQYAYPSAGLQTHFGTALIYNKTRNVYSAGFNSAQFGTGKVERHTIEFVGENHARFGNALVYNKTQIITVSAGNQARFGTLWVSTNPRRIYHRPGTAAHTKYGVSHFTHTRITPPGFLATKFGLTEVGGGVQYVYAAPIFNKLLGNNNYIYLKNQPLQLEGFLAAKFGQGSLDPLTIGGIGISPRGWPYSWNNKVCGTRITDVGIGNRAAFGIGWTTHSPRYLYSVTLGVTTKWGDPIYGLMHTFPQNIDLAGFVASTWGRDDWDYSQGSTLHEIDYVPASAGSPARFGQASVAHA